MKKFVKILSLMVCVVLGVVMLTGCAPSNVEKAKEKMNKAGYTSVSISLKDYSDYEGITGGIVSTRKVDKDTPAGEIGSSIIVLYFDSAKSAKTAFDKANEDKKFDKKTVGRSGKCIYIGTEAAVKAFK